MYCVQKLRNDFKYKVIIDITTKKHAIWRRNSWDFVIVFRRIISYNVHTFE
jgi:hypothetical protein